MAPLFLTGCVYTGSRGQTKPFASKYSIFFGRGPSLSCFSILPRCNTNTSESHFSMTCFFLNPDLHIPWVRLCPGNRTSCTINLIFWLIEGSPEKLLWKCTAYSKVFWKCVQMLSEQQKLGTEREVGIRVPRALWGGSQDRWIRPSYLEFMSLAQPFPFLSTFPKLFFRYFLLVLPALIISEFKRNFFYRGGISRPSGPHFGHCPADVEFLGRMCKNV